LGFTLPMKAEGSFVRRSSASPLVTEGAQAGQKGFFLERSRVEGQKERMMFPAEVTGSIWVRGICSSGIPRKPGA
jgi:hypothetical protein